MNMLVYQTNSKRNECSNNMQIRPKGEMKCFNIMFSNKIEFKHEIIG